MGLGAVCGQVGGIWLDAGCGRPEASAVAGQPKACAGVITGRSFRVGLCRQRDGVLATSVAM